MARLIHEHILCIYLPGRAELGLLGLMAPCLTRLGR